MARALSKQASKIVSTATRPAGQVTLNSTCPAFWYDKVFFD